MAAPLSGLRFDFDRDSFASKVRGELSEAAADDCDCCHAVANRCDADHRSTKWLRRASGVFAKDDAVECRETQSRLRLRAKEFAAPSAAFIEGCSTARVGVPRKHGQISRNRGGRCLGNSGNLARNGHCCAATACLLSEPKRKTCARREYFAF
jgi:hypothetical protein